MKFGISPVVATVLLIAITVTASITTWYWLASYTLKPALTETIYKVFTVVSVYKNSSKTGCNALDIKNAGGTTVSNTLLYVKDYATGKPAGGNGTNPPYQAYVNLSNLEAGKTSVFSINGLGSLGFSETSISDEPILVTTVAIGDANNDGKNETVIGLYNNSVSNKIRMYENKSGRWVETNISDELNTVYKVLIGDPNNDGRNEVVVALDLIPNETRMYENKSGGWVETNISDEPTAVFCAAVGDANNDGKNETVVGMYDTTNELRMHENKSGKWVETNISDEPTSVESLAIGDANNDGKNEVVIGMYDTTNEVRMYENKSGGWVETNISDTPTFVYSVAIGDANNDGKNETVIGIASTTNELRMYENKSGGWVETNISDVPNGVMSVSIGDVNNDARKEIVVTLTGVPSGNEVRMYENKSGGWIGTDVSGHLNNNVNSAAIGDPDNDGTNEIVIGIGSTDSKVRMYENTVGIVSLPFGTYTLRTSASGFADQIFTCA